MSGSYKNLIVWKKSILLVTCLYEVTEKFPKKEVFGLVSQMRRSAVSIPSNIAEGSYRGTKKEFAQFARIAYGSGAELETQIEIAKRLPDTKMLDYRDIDALLEEVMKMLNALLKKLMASD